MLRICIEDQPVVSICHFLVVRPAGAGTGIDNSLLNRFGPIGSASTWGADQRRTVSKLRLAGSHCEKDDR